MRNAILLRDARGDLVIVTGFGQQTVHAFDFIHDLALCRLANTIGIAEVVNGGTIRLELDALVFPGQETGGPLAS